MEKIDQKLIKSTASLPMARPVMHRRAASDTHVMILMQGIDLFQPPVSDDDFDLEEYDLKLQLGDHAKSDSLSSDKNPSSGTKDAVLLPESSINIEAPNEGPNSLPEAPKLASTSVFDAPEMDPKRLRRLYANRKSAQRSRIRKQVYVDTLKWNVHDIEQTTEFVLRPRVTYFDSHYKRLKRENDELKARLQALKMRIVVQNAEFEELMREREALMKALSKMIYPRNKK